MNNINKLLLTTLIITSIGYANSQSSPHETSNDRRATWCDRPVAAASEELNLEVVLKIESQVSQVKDVLLKSEPGPVRAEGYARFYALSENNESEIHGRWIGTPWCAVQNEIQLVDFNWLPVVFDGGCGVISLVWNTKSQTLTYLACNGSA